VASWLSVLPLEAAAQRLAIALRREHPRLQPWVCEASGGRPARLGDCSWRGEPEHSEAVLASGTGFG